MNLMQVFLIVLGIFFIIFPLPSFFKQITHKRSLFVEGRTALGVSAGCLLITLATNNNLYEKSGSLICVVGLMLTIVFVAVARAHLQNIVWKWLWRGKSPIERLGENENVLSQSSERDMPKDKD